MKVRDKTLKKTEYKGREVEGIDTSCPCKPCFHVHDCGRTNSQGKWDSHFACATNWNSGCPSDHTQRQPEHVYKSNGRVCIRCGHTKPSKAELERLLKNI
jgi:hypothetical protein